MRARDDRSRVRSLQFSPRYLGCASRAGRKREKRIVRVLACYNELDAQRLAAAPDDLTSLSFRMVRHERKSKAGPDFGSCVDDDLRTVLRNIRDAALARGCLTIKRDPRRSVAAPANFALLLCGEHAKCLMRKR